MMQDQWRQGFVILSDGEPAEQWMPTEPNDPQAWMALSADPQAVRRVGSVPAEGVLAQAPLGEYDVIELSVFDHPVARVRWTVGMDGDGSGGAGALSQVEAVGDGTLPDPAVVPVLVEAALDEAWQGGAEVVTTLVPAPMAPLYVDAGWTLVEAVRRSGPIGEKRS